MSLQEDIAMLQDYSLIRESQTDQRCSIHRLVQLSMRRWLEASGKLKMWQGRCVAILKTAFPKKAHDDWHTCQALFPHVEAVFAEDVEASLNKQHFFSMPPSSPYNVGVFL